MKLLNLLNEQVQQTFFEEFKSWWMEKRNNDEDPINIKFDLPHNEGDFQRSLQDAIDVGTDIFYVLAKLWEMWAKDSDNEQLYTLSDMGVGQSDLNNFGETLYAVMKKNDFIFDTEAAGAETAVDRQDKDAFSKEYPDVGLNEKKIGFNRGAEYDEEAADEFDNFAVEVGQLYQTMKDKTFAASDDDKQADVDAITQQILTLIDKDTEGDLRTQFEELSKLINSLPDKPTEKEKIGFRQAVDEFYMYNKTK